MQFGHHNESLPSTGIRLRLMLQTRISYTLFVARQLYQRGICNGQNGVYITPLGGIQQTYASETAAKSVTTCFSIG